MSDDVQRYMMYYDDLVPDDKGTWIRLEDYEALRADLAECREAIKNLIGNNGVFFTREQIQRVLASAHAGNQPNEARDAKMRLIGILFPRALDGGVDDDE